MSVGDKLRELGYDTTPGGISRFQRDYNKLAPARRLLITGSLDPRTRLAVEEISRGAAEMFKTLVRS